MGESEVCPIEDAIQAFLDYLVDPMLPAKSSLWDTPSLSHQQSVAKQMHAVVLLYNYYLRKRKLQLEVLGFQALCKLAVILKPTLLAHMKLMQRSNDTELDDLEKQFSVTEKRIMEACDISTSLDASKDVPNIEGWPISKVAVLLFEYKKENCFLLFSSITQGVWSVIGKDLDISNLTLEGMADAKQVDKKKRFIRKPLKGELSVDESGVLRLAYLAVKEATDWEVEVVLSFFGLLYFSRRRQGGEDCIRWIPSKRKLFEVRSFFHELSTSGASSFPWRSIWKVKVPMRVSFFVWTAALDKILIVDNLRKREVLVVGWCCMCKRSGESIDHLLLHCDVARDLWTAIFSLFGITWVMPETVQDMLVCWRGQIGNRSIFPVWRIAPLCVMWIVWR